MAHAEQFIDQLQIETRAHLARIAALPFFSALARGELPRESYGAWLQALEIVHRALEDELLPAADRLSALYDPNDRKLARIQRELSQATIAPDPQFAPALLNAYLLASQMRQRSAHDPTALPGYLYALAGPALHEYAPPTRGASPRRRRTSQAQQSAFADATWLAQPWQRWTVHMRAALAAPPAQDAAIAAVREALSGLERIVAALHPVIPRRLPDEVAVLNPRAGNHAIPGDLREIEAALRAGEATWHAFPYYEWRYGQRGQDYTRSDSAWLVTLTRHPTTVAHKQIAWLGRVLSARGMPQWMLEVHLETLYNALVAVIPDNAAQYAVLLSASRMLRDMRLAHISHDAFETLARFFEAQVGSEWSTRLPRAGELLVAAVADEQAGIANAVASLESWMTDPARFPEHWIAAGHATVRRAREQAR